MWKRNPWKDVKHAEAALAQETAELQIPGGSAAVRAPRKQHFCLMCISTLPWGPASGLCRKQETVPWAFGLGAVAFYQFSLLREFIPLASFHHVPAGFKAKREEGKPTFKREFSGRHKCSCPIAKMTFMLDRGSFVMVARNSALNHNKYKAILSILCLFLLKYPEY